MEKIINPMTMLVLWLMRQHWMAPFTTLLLLSGPWLIAFNFAQLMIMKTLLASIMNHVDPHEMLPTWKYCMGCFQTVWSSNCQIFITFWIRCLRCCSSWWSPYWCGLLRGKCQCWQEQCSWGHGIQLPSEFRYTTLWGRCTASPSCTSSVHYTRL